MFICMLVFEENSEIYIGISVRTQMYTVLI